MTEKKRLLKGTVLDRAGRRYEGVVVRLWKSRVRPEIVTTDDDGDFQFDLSDEQRWPPGEYSAEAMHSQLLPLELPATISLEEGKSPRARKIVLPARSEHSLAAGLCFMATVFAFLGFLIWGYFALHDQRLPLSSELSAFLDQANDQAGTATLSQQGAAAAAARERDAEALYEQVSSAAEQLSEEGPDELRQARQAVQEAQASLEEAGSKREVAVLKAQNAFDEAHGIILQALGILDALQESEPKPLDGPSEAVTRALFAEALASAEDRRGTRLRRALTVLDESVSGEDRLFFWKAYPQRLLEVLFWALGATLIRLLFNSGTWLHSRTFYWSAIPRHLALIVTTPILAVLIAFVLSLVNVNIGLNEEGLDLDMGNVGISIVVGSLIGLAPWRAWDFMQGLADVLFKRLRELTGGTG